MTEAWLGDRDDPGGGLRQKLTHFEIPKRGSGPGRRASRDRSRPRDKGLQRIVRKDDRLRGCLTL